MELYLIKLLLAHLVGDFFLQPSSWVAEKEQKKLGSDKLYLHVAIHTVLVFIVFADLKIWKLAFAIGLLHFIIDAIKLLVQNKRTSRIWFFADQALHIAAIIGCWAYFLGGKMELHFFAGENFWILAIGAVFLSMPAAIIMRVIIARWVPTSIP
ncbi:MAG: DUF3307 domain-containing protein, partial [Pedobacter sp.]